ncbi:hypothetical protein WJX84_001263 [Apatococcus fuscideae]|uniref:Uncharacterized protein n=1 Tax=Apatococcus fuscideae TaxID=2026836 RepID=A0AAW1SYD5_9CHLO
MLRELPVSNGPLTSGTGSSIYGSANSQEVLSDTPITPTSVRSTKRADSRTAALIRKGLGKANPAGKIHPPWVNPSRHADLPQVAQEPRTLPHEQRSGIALRAARSRAISAEQNARELQRQRVALEEQVKSLKRLVKDQSKTIQDLARRLNSRNTHDRRKHEREPVAPLDPVAEDHTIRSDRESEEESEFADENDEYAANGLGPSSIQGPLAPSPMNSRRGFGERRRTRSPRAPRRPQVVWTQCKGSARKVGRALHPEQVWQFARSGAGCFGPTPTTDERPL